MSACYPLLWWYARTQPPTLILLAIVMAILWLVRALIDKQSLLGKYAPWIAALFACFALLGKAEAFMWYSLIINLIFLSLFTYSLKKTPMIETFARLHHPNLPPTAKPYLRRITKIWIAFFIVNGSIIATLSLCHLEQAWTLYTGVISYLLIAALLLGEWIYRKTHHETI